MLLVDSGNLNSNVLASLMRSHLHCLLPVLHGCLDCWLFPSRIAELSGSVRDHFSQDSELVEVEQKIPATAYLYVQGSQSLLKDIPFIFTNRYSKLLPVDSKIDCFS